MNPMNGPRFHIRRKSGANGGSWQPGDLECLYMNGNLGWLVWVLALSLKRSPKTKG